MEVKFKQWGWEMLRVRGGATAEMKRWERKTRDEGMRLGKDGTVEQADCLGGGGRTGMGKDGRGLQAQR